MKADRGIRSRIRRGLLRTLKDERGDGSIAVLIGAVVFFMISVGSISMFIGAVTTSASISVNAERIAALNAQISNFNAQTWEQVLINAAEGIKGPVTSTTDNPFLYYTRIAQVQNVDMIVSTPGGATNSDGAYKIEFLAPKLNHKISECTQFPRQTRPNVGSGCIYIIATRAPMFADAAAVPSWQGFKSTFIPQVSGKTVISGAQSRDIAKLNTCAMKVERVRISFRWDQTPGSTLIPQNISHILNDGRDAEKLNLSTTGIGVIGDFNRGTSSICGDNNRISLKFVGNGSGTLSALLIAPVSNGVIVGTNVPGIPLDPKMQADINGIWSISWNKPTSNTMYPATSYLVTSSCNPTPTIINPTSNPLRSYSGGTMLLELSSGETIEQFIDRCPVYKVIAVGDNGQGLVQSFTLGSIDAEFTGITATQSAATNKITVSFAGIPQYIKNRIDAMNVYYCYNRVSTAEGCFVTPILDLKNADKVGPISFNTANTFVFDGPSKVNVKNKQIILQTITDNARQATQSGSNVITLTLQ